MPNTPSSTNASPVSMNWELKNLKYALDQAAIVAVTDRAGAIIYVNDKFCSISKYKREELIGKTHRIIKSDYHSSEFFVELWKTISRGEIWEGEIRNRAKDGSFYWVNTTIVPFLDEAGLPQQYIAIRYEITQRKLAESKLVHYASKLERSNRELQDFASVAAHDLQEPLRKIQAFSDRVKKRLGTTIGADVADYLERMRSAASRMQRLIDDLLTYSRVTTQAQPLAPTDLNDILADVVSDLEMRIEQTRGQIELRPLPVIDADPVQMRQLFQNLVGNALKFHKPEFAPRVVVSSQPSSNAQECEIWVEDNGIGFDEKYLERIFTIFQRLHGRLEYEGTGVGLAVCRRIVDRHSGFITAQSQLGVGSRFIVVLPLRSKNTEGEV